MSTVATPIPQKTPARNPVLLVVFCTFLGAAAQILMKTGANRLVHAGLIGMITNLPLMAGYVCYGIFTVLLVLALRDGELSLLYPIIALNYVWVTALSFFIFHDRINPFKLIGVCLIVVGVGVLGQGSRK